LSAVPITPWRKPGVRGDIGNIIDSIDGLWNHILFPKPSEEEKLSGWKPSGRTIQLFLLVYVLVLLAATLWRHLSATHFTIVMLVGGLFLALEGMNTTIEMICDWQESGENEHVRMIKHASAGAVLIAAITTLITWTIMFINPR
jgi:undecaprenol kinase/diacylglycerol kinase (ATP)